MRSTTNVATTPCFVCGRETVAACLELSLRQTVHSATDGLGHLEERLADGTLELQHQAIERAGQAKADATSTVSPAAHFGDVLGIRSGAIVTAREQVKTP